MNLRCMLSDVHLRVTNTSCLVITLSTLVRLLTSSATPQSSGSLYPALSSSLSFSHQSQALWRTCFVSHPASPYISPLLRRYSALTLLCTSTNSSSALHHPSLHRLYNLCSSIVRTDTHTISSRDAHHKLFGSHTWSLSCS